MSLGNLLCSLRIRVQDFGGICQRRIAVGATFLLLSSASFAQNAAHNQHFIIKNESKSLVAFRVSATDKKNSDLKYISIASAVEPGKTVFYNSPLDVVWSGKNPVSFISYTSLSASYSNASGDCTVNASNDIGAKKNNLASEAVLNTDKCDGATGAHLNLVWSSENNNVIVTIK